MGKNDEAWERLFQKYSITEKVHENGQFFISAKQIKQFREPRLMTKFDHSINLPSVFSDNDLAVLPISRGEYVISSFSAYKTMDEADEACERVSVPAYIQSISPKFIVSEAIALNCAYSCGILSDFLDDEELIPTVNGRMGSGRFDFNITTKAGKRTVSVNNAQIEIDAAFEGVNYLSLFEAKHDFADDFIVRQLYYPYRTWKERVTKKVKSVFLTFSNGVFDLFEYNFDDPYDYNSLILVKKKKYALSTDIKLCDIQKTLNSVEVIPEPEIPFPQADKMSRIINLIESLDKKPMSLQQITQKYGFDARQASYYAEAGRYLGLIERFKKDANVMYGLSPAGCHAMSLDYRERQLLFAGKILEHKVFNDVLRLCLNVGEMPDKNTIVIIMKNAFLYNVGADSTFERRSSTVSGWINWILSIIDE